MKQAAAIAAQVVDIQNDRQHKGFIKVTLHVAAERGALLTEALGWPTYTEPVPVALARLNPEKIVVQNELARTNIDTSPVSGPDIPARARKPVDPEKRLAQQAGILCGDPLFQRFLQEKITNGAPVNDENDAAFNLRMLCGVDSRKSIIPGSEAAIKFDELKSKFVAWRDADIYVEPSIAPAHSPASEREKERVS